jgi:hypothetical protein
MTSELSDKLMGESTFAAADEVPEPVMAYVLFIDLVGYSKLPTNHQSRAVQRLQDGGSAFQRI